MVSFMWITCNNNPILSLETVYLSNYQILRYSLQMTKPWITQKQSRTAQCRWSRQLISLLWYSVEIYKDFCNAPQPSKSYSANKRGGSTAVVKSLCDISWNSIHQNTSKTLFHSPGKKTFSVRKDRGHYSSNLRGRQEEKKGVCRNVAEILWRTDSKRQHCGRRIKNGKEWEIFRLN